MRHERAEQEDRERGAQRPGEVDEPAGPRRPQANGAEGRGDQADHPRSVGDEGDRGQRSEQGGCGYRAHGTWYLKRNIVGCRASPDASPAKTNRTGDPASPLVLRSEAENRPRPLTV